jgi:hypothetical protein
MRIHTTIDSWEKISDALTAEKAAGRIASHVYFKTLRAHRSTAKPYAYEVQLGAKIRDDGRRAGNTGSYGSMRPEIDDYAATYDEWGWLLAALYALDPWMTVGTPAHPVYADRENFDHKTAYTYNPAELLPLLEAGHWPTFVDADGYDGGDPYPYVTGRAAKSKRGYMIGRRGADRHDDSYPAYLGRKLAPRTPAEVRAFAYPTGVTA